MNYNLRLLGRRGVRVLNAVADMAQLKQVESAPPQIHAAVDFQEGHRYADFNESTDKTAPAALVAGGVAAKTWNPFRESAPVRLCRIQHLVVSCFLRVTARCTP